MDLVTKIFTIIDVWGIHRNYSNYLFLSLRNYHIGQCLNFYSNTTKREMLHTRQTRCYIQYENSICHRTPNASVFTFRYLLFRMMYSWRRYHWFWLTFCASIPRMLCNSIDVDIPRMLCKSLIRLFYSYLILQN